MGWRPDRGARYRQVTPFPRLRGALRAFAVVAGSPPAPEKDAGTDGRSRLAQPLLNEARSFRRTPCKGCTRVDGASRLDHLSLRWRSDEARRHPFSPLSPARNTAFRNVSVKRNVSRRSGRFLSVCLWFYLAMNIGTTRQPTRKDPRRRPGWARGEAPLQVWSCR